MPEGANPGLDKSSADNFHHFLLPMALNYRRALVNYYQGDVRVPLDSKDYDIPRILDHIQNKHKEGFPRLYGPKISNYWLYVLLDYTSAPLKNRCCLSIAPDTHVIQASIKFGIVVHSDQREGGLPAQVAGAWEALLTGTGICPIDIHHSPLGFLETGSAPLHPTVSSLTRSLNGAEPHAQQNSTPHREYFAPSTTDQAHRSPAG